MSHPMEGHYDAERAASDIRWARIRKMQEQLKAIPFSAFNAADALAICAVMEPSILEKAFDKDQKLDAALDRLEAVLAGRKKPAKPRRRPR